MARADGLSRPTRAGTGLVRNTDSPNDAPPLRPQRRRRETALGSPPCPFLDRGHPRSDLAPPKPVRRKRLAALAGCILDMAAFGPIPPSVVSAGRDRNQHNRNHRKALDILKSAMTLRRRSNVKLLTPGILYQSRFLSKFSRERHLKVGSQKGRGHRWLNPLSWPRNQLVAATLPVFLLATILVQIRPLWAVNQVVPKDARAR
jgi:hypothetical protein